MLQARARVGDEYIPVDALQACYISEGGEQEEPGTLAERQLQPGEHGEEVAAQVRVLAGCVRMPAGCACVKVCACEQLKPGSVGGVLHPHASHPPAPFQ